MPRGFQVQFLKYLFNHFPLVMFYHPQDTKLAMFPLWPSKEKVLSWLLEERNSYILSAFHIFMNRYTQRLHSFALSSWWETFQHDRDHTHTFFFCLLLEILIQDFCFFLVFYLYFVCVCLLSHVYRVSSHSRSQRRWQPHRMCLCMYALHYSSPPSHSNRCLC